MKNIQSIEEFVNESNETTVDKVLTPKEKKALKSAMESVYLGIDKLSFKRDGSIVAKEVIIIDIVNPLNQQQMI